MGKGLYYLIYVGDGERGVLSLRGLTPDSRDFIRISGKRSAELFNGVMSVIDAYALKYSISKDGDKTVVELPADVGYAVLIYLLLTYSAKEPNKWLNFLERLLAGKAPLSKYLNVFVHLAIDLSNLKYGCGGRGAIIKPTAARTVSSMMRVLIENL
ncbi:hypothetical protein [Infirmifilum sp.]|uniref:hypothetical protein n=1 Tax=Infirmifilum sp. TaxID=2856575 RepID=UPI003D143BA1